MMFPLSVLDVAATTGLSDALIKTVPDVSEPGRVWYLALTDDTDGAVSVSFDGVNEHLRLTPLKHPTETVRYNAVKLWAWKVTGGAVFKLVVAGSTSPEV